MRLAALLLSLGAAVGGNAVPFSLPAQTTTNAALPSFRDEFLGQFDGSMEKLIALAEAIPADKFSWAPGPGVMPVAKVYAHIAHYNFGYPSEEMGVPLPAGIKLDTLEGVSEKAQVIALLQRSREYVQGAVKAMSDGSMDEPTKLYGRRVPKSAVLFQLVAHMNEHLGQSIAYARMNGIVPPWSR